jgi:transcriptional regulator with XRE-family HTH domain
MNGFSDMLTYLRKRENLTQSELAEKLNIGRSAVSMYESGKREPSFETLEEIADFFNVNMSTLLGQPEEIPAPKLSDKKQKLFDLINTLPDDKVDSIINLLEK